MFKEDHQPMLFFFSGIIGTLIIIEKAPKLWIAVVSNGKFAWFSSLQTFKFQGNKSKQKTS